MPRRARPLPAPPRGASTHVSFPTTTGNSHGGAQSLKHAVPTPLIFPTSAARMLQRRFAVQRTRDVPGFRSLDDTGQKVRSLAEGQMRVIRARARRTSPASVCRTGGESGSREPRKSRIPHHSRPRNRSVSTTRAMKRTCDRSTATHFAGPGRLLPPQTIRNSSGPISGWSPSGIRCAQRRHSDHSPSGNEIDSESISRQHCANDSAQLLPSP
jgi:hypothetical protein